MPKNSESLNRSLFDLLHSKGFDPTMLDTSGKEIPTPEEAEVFQFNFIKDGEDYGKVTISVDGLHKLCVYYSDDVANSEKEESHGEDESWYKVLNQLKRFAQKYQLSFELRNVDHLKHDMAKREYMKKQERISEGYYPMGKKASYNDAVPNVKIVIQHTRQIEEGEQRYRNIAKIFLENSEGERFLAPTIKPGVARVYGRLIAEGDKPHGERWNHVTSLVEEYQKMGAFVRATRNGQFNESAQRLVNQGINHYQGLRETLSRMTGHRGYNTYFESWTPSLMEEESEENNLNELFVQETLDPRIESVMPILNKLQKKVAEMKEVGALSEWADNIIDEGAAVDAYMAGKSPALAHFADKLDKEIDEGSDDIDDPVVSAITRRIIRQHPELLKHGPDKVLAAIADVADFVGDVEEIGSSDVSGWVKQVARSLGSMGEGMFEEELDEQRFPDNSTSTAKRDMVVTNLHDLIKDPRQAHEPVRHGPGNPKVKMATRVMPSLTKEPVKKMAGDEVEEGSFGDMAKKVGGAIKSAGSKVLDKLGHGSDEELLKKLQKDVGAPAGSQHGKPSMAKPNDDTDIIESDMEEGKGPLGQGDLGLALKSLGGSWSSWHEENSHDPDIEVYEYDDGEGGYYASGSIEHNLKTGEIEVHYQDGENDVDVDGTFNSIGDAMKALRGGNSYPSWGGKKPNFDRLGQRKQHGPDDLRKTDRTGRKGTLAGGPTNSLKQNIQWSKGKHGPKGVLPEGQEDLDAIRRLLKK